MQMKNPYELAKNILELTGKSEQAVPGTGFNSINLYGNSVRTKGGEDDAYTTILIVLLLVHVVYIGIRCYVKDWREERGYY